MAELYVAGDVDQVVMVYNRFVSALTQQLETLEVLPVPKRRSRARSRSAIEGAYLEEPDRSEILRHLLPTYVEVTIFRALLESTASEHGARMTAMGNASENAVEPDRLAHPRDEPRAPGRDHAADPRGRRRR